MSGALLELHGATCRFGGLVAVNALDMAVDAGTVHGVIGPNGAGKSTTFDLVSGLRRLSAGRIMLDGADISRASVEARVSAGICRTFQTPRLFEQMTVLETVLTGLHVHGQIGMWRGMFSVLAKAREEAAFGVRARDIMERVGLAAAEAHRPVAALSYGKRRLVEIARALATRPRLLLLDEVASGLNPVETRAISALVQGLVADGITVVIVEHDMPFVMALCDRVTVLNFGTRIADGRPAEVTGDADVIEAYLGRPRDRSTPRRDGRRDRYRVAEG